MARYDLLLTDVGQRIPIVTPPGNGGPRRIADSTCASDCAAAEVFGDFRLRRKRADIGFGEPINRPHVYPERDGVDLIRRIQRWDIGGFATVNNNRDHAAEMAGVIEHGKQPFVVRAGGCEQFLGVGCAVAFGLQDQRGSDQVIAEIFG